MSRVGSGGGGTRSSSVSRAAPRAIALKTTYLEKNEQKLHLMAEEEELLEDSREKNGVAEISETNTLISATAKEEQPQQQVLNEPFFAYQSQEMDRVRATGDRRTSGEVGAGRRGSGVIGAYGSNH